MASGINNGKQVAFVRLIVMAIAMLNQTLTMFGWNPLPYSDEQIYEGVSAVFAIASTLWAYWKNNNITPEARKADDHMRNMKDRKKSTK